MIHGDDSLSLACYGLLAPSMSLCSQKPWTRDDARNSAVNLIIERRELQLIDYSTDARGRPLGSKEWFKFRGSPLKHTRPHGP